MPQWREQYAGVEELKVAVMGCIVDGPANPNTPISEFRCPAPPKSQKPRVYMMAA